MKRREAIKNVAFLVGGVISVSSMSIFLESCNPVVKKNDGELVSKDQELLIEEIVETIIPKTKTPGAKQAGVGAYVLLIIKDCSAETVQHTFLEGLEQVEKQAKGTYKDSFVNLSQENKESLLRSLDSSSPDFMKLITRLTKRGYFSSEIGATQALSLVVLPGRYDGCMQLQDHQKAWAL